MTSLHLNLEGGQLFFLTKGKGPHEGTGYFHQHYVSLDVVMVLRLIHTCRDLSGVIFDNDQYEDTSNIIFLLRAGISD